MGQAISTSNPMQGIAIIGETNGNTLEKDIIESEHIYRKNGPKICFSVDVLEKAEARGVTMLHVHSDKREYWATVSYFRHNAVVIPNYGFGAQLGLHVQRWASNRTDAPI